MPIFNVTGFIFVVVLMIPNILYAVRTRGGECGRYKNKAVETGEQIGRFGCLAFMVIQLPAACMGYLFPAGKTVYLIAGIVLLCAYCVGWLIFWRENSVRKALVLSVLPTVLFFESGLLTLNIPLIILAVIFGVCHITISYKNTKKE